MKQAMFAAVLVAGALLFTTPAAADDGEAESDLYRVRSELGTDHARQFAEKLQAYAEHFNSYLRFEMDQLPALLRVRIFATEDEFRSYVERHVDESRNEFVYLHYENVAQRELVGFDMKDRDQYHASLAHQAFVQYLRAFVPHPPLWLREGFAVYFETLRYDIEQGSVYHPENLAWLEEVQRMVRGEAAPEPMPAEELLMAQPEEAREQIDAFYPQAWAAVSFLLNSEERRYNRMIWDAISALQPEADLSENSRQVYDRAIRWIDEQQLFTSFVNYIESRRSFRTLVETGAKDYEAGDLDQARQAFKEATEIRPREHIPHYYLGLIAYAQEEYEEADGHYLTALEQGAPEALTLYARGVNAYAADQPTEAREFLQLAAEQEPERFGDPAEEILRRLEG